MKGSMTGFLLAWQFFSAIPINKQLDLNRKSVTWMYVFLPIVGLFMGSVVAVSVYGLLTLTNFSTLLIAILVLVLMILLTGGLHLDGWIDMSDAFFSYKDKEKRLQILDDPRTGAFGVLSIICLLLLKLGFLYEVLDKAPVNLYVFFIVIPFIARSGMIVYFASMSTSKETGLAAYFKGVVDKKGLIARVLLITCVAIFCALYFVLYEVVLLYGVMLIAVYIYRNWSYKQFGGMSGDLLGALGEGLEVLLWFVLLWCI